jgi:hypothetical protein
MKVINIIIRGASLTPANSYYIYNLDVLKDNITDAIATKRGIRIDCDFNCGIRKADEIKRKIKMMLGAKEISFVCSEKK